MDVLLKNSKAAIDSPAPAQNKLRSKLLGRMANLGQKLDIR
jgi:hypothetical protein